MRPVFIKGLFWGPCGICTNVNYMNNYQTSHTTEEISIEPILRLNLLTMESCISTILTLWYLKTSSRLCENNQKVKERPSYLCWPITNSIVETIGIWRVCSKEAGLNSSQFKCKISQYHIDPKGKLNVVVTCVNSNYSKSLKFRGSGSSNTEVCKIK